MIFLKLLEESRVLFNECNFKYGKRVLEKWKSRLLIEVTKEQPLLYLNNTRDEAQIFSFSYNWINTEFYFNFNIEYLWYIHNKTLQDGNIHKLPIVEKVAKNKNGLLFLEKISCEYQLENYNEIKDLSTALPFVVPFGGSNISMLVVDGNHRISKMIETSDTINVLYFDWDIARLSLM